MIVLARGFALVVAAVLVAAVLVLLIGFETLRSPAHVQWLVVIAGTPAPMLVAAALSRRWWHAASGFCVCGLGIVVGLAHISVPWWSTDLGQAGGVASLRCAVYITAGALASAGLVRLRRAARARRVGIAVAILSVGAVSATVEVMDYFRGYGLLPFLQGSRLVSYDRLWRNLERFYVRWDRAPLPLGDLRDRYRGRVDAADRECGYLAACPAYCTAIRDMLAELQDGHTHLLSPCNDDAIPPLSIEAMEHEAVITRGRWRGYVIRTVDNRAVEHVMATAARHAIAFSAPHTRKREAYRRLLAGPPGTPVQLVVEAPDRTAMSITLWRTDEVSGAPAPVRARGLGEQLVYVAVPHLRSAAVVAEFDHQLGALGDARGLVLDLRGNGGGSSRLGDDIVGRLITERVLYGAECFRGRHPLRTVDGCIERSVEPRPPVAAERIAVLLDGDVASSAEQMAAALCINGRARCFGAPTAGDSGNPLPHFLPGVMLQFSNGEIYLRDGAILDGNGIAPDVRVEVTRADVIAGRDPVLDAAVHWLQAE